MSGYVIRGGEAGKRRLEILARINWPATFELLKSLDVREGMTCLDLGCIEFRDGVALDWCESEVYDLACARFLLTHLPGPCSPRCATPCGPAASSSWRTSTSPAASATRRTCDGCGGA